VEKSESSDSNAEIKKGLISSKRTGVKPTEMRKNTTEERESGPEGGMAKMKKKERGGKRRKP